MLDKLTHEDFAHHLNTTFHIHYGEGEKLPVQLTSVTPSPHMREGHRRGFSLLFQSQLDAYLAQAIHAVEHPAMGTLHMFLVPVGSANGGMRYEAVFN